MTAYRMDFEGYVIYREALTNVQRYSGHNRWKGKLVFLKTNKDLLELMPDLIY
jgi:hypothetical protein